MSANSSLQNTTISFKNAAASASGNNISNQLRVFNFKKSSTNTIPQSSKENSPASTLLTPTNSSSKDTNCKKRFDEFNFDKSSLGQSNRSTSVFNLNESNKIDSLLMIRSYLLTMNANTPLSKCSMPELSEPRIPSKPKPAVSSSPSASSELLLHKTQDQKVVSSQEMSLASSDLTTPFPAVADSDFDELNNNYISDNLWSGSSRLSYSNGMNNMTSLFSLSASSSEQELDYNVDDEQSSFSLRSFKMDKAAVTADAFHYRKNTRNQMQLSREGGLSASMRRRRRKDSKFSSSRSKKASDSETVVSENELDCRSNVSAKNPQTTIAEKQAYHTQNKVKYEPLEQKKSKGLKLIDFK